MKQTAVEWLIESIESLEYNVKNKIISTEDYDINLEWVKKKAKDLEKQQIINTYIEASENFDDITKEIAKQFYKETYGK